MISRVTQWAFFATALLVVVALTNRVRADADSSSLEGKEAPALTLSVLGSSTSAKLADQKGNVVLMDFWATWCPPCRASLPHIQKLSDDKDRAAKGLKVWAANAHEAPEVANKFLKDNNYSFIVPQATGDDMEKYLIQGIPTTVIVGRDGKIAKVFVGYGGEETDKQIEAAIDDALKVPAQ